MNDISEVEEEKLNKKIYILHWVLISCTLLIIILLYNIGNDAGKRYESDHCSTCGEGIGMLGALFGMYLIYYQSIFLLWIIILNLNKKEKNTSSRRIQYRIIFLFAVPPTFLFTLLLLVGSPNPFKTYPRFVNPNPQDTILNGKRIVYSADSIILYEAEVENGNLVGKEIRRYPNGQIQAEKNYQQGAENGEAIEYYPNGCKSSWMLYQNGTIKTSIHWHQNGHMSYLNNPDSNVNWRYEWWDNGQIRAHNFNGHLYNYWQKDGQKTMTHGTGYILSFDQQSGKILQKSIYESSDAVRETCWYENGNVSLLREYVTLTKQESEELGFKNCSFYGRKESRYFKDGKLQSLTYWSYNNCRTKDDHPNVQFNWDENGNFIKK